MAPCKYCFEEITEGTKGKECTKCKAELSSLAKEWGAIQGLLCHPHLPEEQYDMCVRKEEIEFMMEDKYLMDVKSWKHPLDPDFIQG